MDDFPGNPIIRATPTPASSTPQVPAAPTESPNLAPIEGLRVVQRKDGLGSRLKKAFIKTDAKTLGTFVLNDLAVPAIQRIVVDIIEQSVKKAFGIEVRLPQNTQGSPLGMIMRTNYNGISQPTVITSSNYTTSRPAISQPSSLDIGPQIVEDEVHAMEICERLSTVLATQTYVTVANLNQLMRLQSQPTDHNFGWRNLDSMSINRIAGVGYQIVLPMPVQLR